MGYQRQSRAVGALALVVAVAASGVAAMTPGAAYARTAHSASAIRAAAAAPPAICVVHSLPSFIAQGENISDAQGEDVAQVSTEATVADVIQVSCDPNLYGTGSKIRITASQLFTRCQGKVTWYVPNPFSETINSRGVTVRIDADGNAIVALRAGPECAAGESLVTAHMEEEPFESFTTSFSVLPPVPTTPGVFALPATQVEDSSSSGVATIIETEFAGGSEKLVHIASEELFHRCQVFPHLRWVRMDGTKEEAVAEVRPVQLDNDGNAFVIALGDASCAAGPSLIEADLLSKPFTTFVTDFTIQPPQPLGQPPQPAAEPSFTIEKRQEIIGSDSGFSTSPLTGSIGQTVKYQIVVKNTGNEALTFSGFIDGHCDPGTIVEPGGTSVAPGVSTTYTCTHMLSSAGTYVNEASITATPQGEPPLTQDSNRVEVNVPAQPGPAGLPQTAGGKSAAPTTSGPAAGEVLGECSARQPVLHNASGPKLTAFTLKVISKGIQQISFYLDGRKLKTLTQHQAKAGKFAIRLDPRVLSYGAHKVSIKVRMSGAGCATIGRSSVFVRPTTQRVVPKFTG